MEFKGNKKPDTYQVFKSNSIKQCSQIWIQLQLASTFSLFFSAALEFFLGFSEQLQKWGKIQTFSTPCPSSFFLNPYDFKSIPSAFWANLTLWIRGQVYSKSMFLVIILTLVYYKKRLIIFAIPPHLRLL